MQQHHGIPTRSMKALAFRVKPTVGEFSARLEAITLPLPIPEQNQVRIKVCATSINIDDVHIMEGSFAGGVPIGPNPSSQKPAIPGSDFAGTIDEIGPGVRGFSIGQRIYGMCHFIHGKGPWAEYCIVEAKNVSPIPVWLSFQHAAALPIAGSVTMEAIKMAGPLTGKTCLVIGASGGIGTICVQALCSANARVWGVCSTKNVDLVRSLGAERVFDYTAKPFAQSIQAVAAKVDLVFDFVGGRETETQALTVIRPGGKYITPVGPVKYVGEKRQSMFSLFRMFLYIGWRVMASRFRQVRYHFISIREPQFSLIKKYLLTQEKQTVIDQVIPLELEPVRRAVSHLLSHRARGKIIVQVPTQATTTQQRYSIPG